MIKIRKKYERGQADHGWLKAAYSFSFASYQDPNHMGFRKLRVINEDVVQPSKGFDTHPHRDMEIITYVLEGALEHQDSMGNGSIIRPGEVQVMSAGTGVRHSEFNYSNEEPVHLLQIWILPNEEGLTPNYQQKDFGELRKNRFCLVASEKGEKGSLVVAQDIKLFASLFSKGHEAIYTINSGRHVWIQVVTGELTVNDQKVGAGDGLQVSAIGVLQIEAGSEAHFLLFDLP